MSEYFPPEILVEILHRLTPKSLVKCTCVCKAWKSLITHHTFISDHLTRTLQTNHGETSLLLHLYRRNREGENKHYEYEEFYSLYSDDDQIDHLSISKFPLNRLFLGKYSRVVGTCNGLVCFADYQAIDRATQIIWNPSIRKYVVLPKPGVFFNNYSYEKHKVFFGFGFDFRNKDFKVVRLVNFNREQDTQVEVYSLANGCWRSTAGRAPPFLVYTHVWKTSQMFVNGVLHWVVNRRSNGGIHNFILTFDVVEETFGELMLPQLLKESAFQVSILAGGDSLAVVLRKESQEFDGNFFRIWVMKEYGVVESWTEVFHFDSRRWGGISRLLAFRNSGEVILQSWNDTIIVLDPTREESLKHLRLEGFFNAFVGNHFESLFLINKEYDVLSY